MSAAGAEYRDLINLAPTWPQYPYLPMKRYTEDGGLPEVGVMVAGAGPRIFDCVLMIAVALPPENVAMMKSWDYTSTDTLLEDEWLVD